MTDNEKYTIMASLRSQYENRLIMRKTYRDTYAKMKEENPYANMPHKWNQDDCKAALKYQGACELARLLGVVDTEYIQTMEADVKMEVEAE